MDQQTLVKYVGTGIVILLLGLITFMIVQRVLEQDRTPVSLYVLPDDSEVTFNEAKVKPGQLFLAPGSYKLEATKDGFSKYEDVVTIEDGEEATVDIALTPESDEAIKWVQQNDKLYQEYEKRAGQIGAEDGDIFYEKNPIAKKLPYKNFLFTIGYKADPSDKSGKSIIITVDAYSSYRQNAMNQISQWGFNPTDLKIEFKNYENPFAS